MSDTQPAIEPGKKEGKNLDERVAHIEHTFRVVKTLAGIFGFGGALGLTFLLMAKSELGNLTSKVATLQGQITELEQKKGEAIKEVKTDAQTQKNQAVEEISALKKSAISEIGNLQSTILKSLQEQETASKMAIANAKPAQPSVKPQLDAMKNELTARIDNLDDTYVRKTALSERLLIFDCGGDSKCTCPPEWEKVPTRGVDKTGALNRGAGKTYIYLCLKK